MTLFGRVPPGHQLALSIMALASLAWPVAVLGVLFPPVATFLFALVTLPSWTTPWLRPVMLAFALLLPAIVGAASKRLGEDRAPLWKSVLRGYPTAVGLFVVLMWMMVLAPLMKVRAILRRWVSAHVTIVVKQGEYERVVRDLVASLSRASVPVRVVPAGWAFEFPGRVLAMLGGPRVRRLVPPRLLKLTRPDLDVVVHPMDLALHGKKEAVSRAQAAISRELTFTEAYQTWSDEAQEVEDQLLRAARGDADLEPIGRRIEGMAIEYEQWEILSTGCSCRCDCTGAPSNPTRSSPSSTRRRRSGSACSGSVTRSGGCGRRGASTARDLNAAAPPSCSARADAPR